MPSKMVVPSSDSLPSAARESRERLSRAIARTTAAIDQGDTAAMCAALSETATLAPRRLARDFIALIELAWYDTELVALRWTDLRAHLEATREPSA